VVIGIAADGDPVADGTQVGGVIVKNLVKLTLDDRFHLLKIEIHEHPSVQRICRISLQELYHPRRGMAMQK